MRQRRETVEHPFGTHSALGRKSNSTLAVVHHFDGLGAKADVARTASICSQRRLDEHVDPFSKVPAPYDEPFQYIVWLAHK